MKAVGVVGMVCRSGVFGSCATYLGPRHPTERCCTCLLHVSQCGGGMHVRVSCTCTACCNITHGCCLLRCNPSIWGLGCAVSLSGLEAHAGSKMGA